MSASLAIGFAGCAFAHVLVAYASSLPWWVPDLTLIGLIMIVTQVPSQWLLLSALAGMWMNLWAVRFPGQILLGYVGVGWLVQILSRSWDTTDLRIQCVCVFVSSFLLTLWMVWLDHLWTLAVLGWSVVRIVVTVLAVPLVRRMVVR